MKRYKIVFVTVIVNQNGTVQTGQQASGGRRRTRRPGFSIPLLPS